MKRIVMSLAAALLLIMTALAVTGCDSEPKTIEYYLSESPSAQQDIEESLAGLNNGDMDIEVTYEGNKIIVNCNLKTTYKKKVRKALRNSYKKYMKKNLREPMENAIASIERETGISGVQIQLIINNGNGKKIWSHTYPRVEKETDAPDQTAPEPESSEPEAETTEATE